MTIVGRNDARGGESVRSIAGEGGSKVDADLSSHSDLRGLAGAPQRRNRGSMI